MLGALEMSDYHVARRARRGVWVLLVHASCSFTAALETFISVLHPVLRAGHRQGSSAAFGGVLVPRRAHRPALNHLLNPVSVCRCVFQFILTNQHAYTQAAEVAQSILDRFSTSFFLYVFHFNSYCHFSWTWRAHVSS
ncbi:hypothetical protein C8J57DRAFT_1329992 [Mycena rebaudengoi]|nr:hypothetical protein C8J57DRAFT_1329992 [Mycena rebaudengoi]